MSTTALPLAEEEGFLLSLAQVDQHCWEGRFTVAGRLIWLNWERAELFAGRGYPWAGELCRRWEAVLHRRIGNPNVQYGRPRG